MTITDPIASLKTPVRRHLVDTDYGQIHVRVTGEAQEGVPPVLLVHQTPSSSREWMSVAQELGPRQCIVPDLIGLGFSDPAPQAMSLVDHATAITQVVSSFSDSWVAVGHHTGAVIATTLTGMNKKSTLGLGIIGYPFYSTWRERYSRLTNCNVTPMDADGEAAAAMWRASAGGYGPTLPEEDVMRIVSDKLLAGPVWFGTYVALWMSDLVQIVETAADSDRPTVLLAPEDDSLSKFAGPVAEILGITPTTMPGGGRVLSEHPDLVAEALAPLLKA